MQIVLLISILLGGVLALGLGHWMLAPVQQAARARRRQVQFTLSDFVWLLMQLQLALAIIVAWQPQPAWAFVLVTIFLTGAVTAMWWGSIRALSQAGVDRPARRALFILLLLPAAELAMGLAAGVGFELGLFGAGLFHRRYRGIAFFPRVDEMLLAMLAGVVLIGLLGYAVRALGQWLVANAASEEAPSNEATTGIDAS